MYRAKHGASRPRALLIVGVIGLALLGAGGLAARLVRGAGASPAPSRPGPVATSPRPSARPTVQRATATPARTLPPSLPPGPLPACDYDEVPTELPAYADWRWTVLDTRFALPAGYEPPDLVSVRLAGFDHDLRVRSFVIPDLRAMGEAAGQAGHPLSMVSAYRGFAQQAGLFDKRAGEIGHDAALRVTARPGHSEHQLGTTIDFVTAGSAKVSRDWLGEPTGEWMAGHAWRYGFVMSYPRGMEAVTCYAFEPWHFRYVGRELAASIHRSGLTPRQYLWEVEHGAASGPSPS
jgi:zinc D-Ala-D-Ala carboxypeptidase